MKIFISLNPQSTNQIHPIMKKVSFVICTIISTSILLAQPANNDCANAIDVTLGTHDFTTEQSTTDGPDHPNCPGYSFGDDQCHNDIWYTITAPSDAFIEFSTCDSINYDSRLAVYAPGSACPPLTDDLIACNDDGAGCYQFSSSLTFPCEAGQTYLLRIGGYASGDLGSGSFSLTEIIPPDPPENNDCADALNAPVVTETQANNDEGWNEGSNENAASIVPEPWCRPFGEFYDVWYRFNSGENDELDVVFEILDDDAEFVVELWEGDCSGPALPIDSGGTFLQTCWIEDEVGIGAWNIADFPGEPTNYMLRIATYVTGDLPGSFRFQLIGSEATTVGIEELDPSSVNIFPNPNNGIFNISASINIQNGLFEMLDLQGRTVHQQNINLIINQNFEIDLSNLKSGIYFVYLFDRNENALLTKKVVIK